MKIIFRKISNEEFDFIVDGDEIGTVEKTITEDFNDGWVAIDHLDGFACEGATKKEAVENLCLQMALNKAQEDLTEELFGK